MTVAAIAVGVVWAGVIVSAIILAIWAAVDDLSRRHHHHRHRATALSFTVGPVTAK